MFVPVNVYYKKGTDFKFCKYEFPKEISELTKCIVE